MPRYVPEGVFGPCYDAGVRIHYYDLNPDLTPDTASISRVMPDKAMVIVIHYFGYPSPTNMIREMVDAANGVLFEDCAQTLYGDVSKAYDADVALWSFNKFLPVSDGAILRSRNLKVFVGGNSAPRSAGCLNAMMAYWKYLDINSKINETSSQLETICLLDKSNAAYENYYGLINGDYTLYPISEESELIESQFDVEKEEKIRVGNAWRMRMVLPSLRNGGELPQFAFPLMLKSEGHRETVYKRLLDLGILASRQVDKWNYVNVKGTLEDDFLHRHLLLPLGDQMDDELVGQIKGAL